MTMRFDRSGRVQAIWDDQLALFYARAFGEGFARLRRRASIINTIEEGEMAGCFYADMSHLAELTGDNNHRCCLWPPTPLESDCKRAEVMYLKRWLRR